MVTAGRILANTLHYLTENFIADGVSSLDISRKAEELIISEGALPAFKGYHGFPEAACVSINKQVVHGIPKESSILCQGDIVSVDCGTVVDGHFSDACRTVAVGYASPQVKKLLKATEEALNRGIEAAIPGNHVGDISYAVQRHVERNRFNVSLEFVGHGIGRVLHGSPCVPNYGPPGTGELLKPGMYLAVEPVVFDGPSKAKLAEDGWTVYSMFNNLSAHFEETIAITEKGPVVLTRL